MNVMLLLIVDIMINRLANKDYSSIDHKSINSLSNKYCSSIRNEWKVDNYITNLACLGQLFIHRRSLAKRDIILI